MFIKNSAIGDNNINKKGPVQKDLTCYLTEYMLLYEAVSNFSYITLDPRDPSVA